MAHMERGAFKANSFDQADKWDVKQHINLTLVERLSIARALKDRIHPKAKHVRECHQSRLAASEKSEIRSRAESYPY